MESSVNWVKKYWWIAILVLALPVVINFILQIPAFTSIVGDSEAWLSFWGGYLGAIVSASVAFIILIIQYRQNKEENRSNRQLQINTIKHQQEQTRLHRITEVSAKIISDTNLAYVSIVCGKIGGPTCDTVDMLEGILKDIETHKNELNLYIKLDSKIPTIRFYSEINNHLSLFSRALNEFSNIARLFIYNKSNVSKHVLNEYLSESKHASDEISKLLIDYTNSEEHVLDNYYFYEIAIIVLNFMKKPQDNICKCINKYISEEKIRIDNILTHNV